MSKTEKAVEVFKANHRMTELNEYGHRTIGTVLPFIEAVELPDGGVTVLYTVVTSVEATEERSIIYSTAQLA